MKTGFFLLLDFMRPFALTIIEEHVKDDVHSNENFGALFAAAASFSKTKRATFLGFSGSLLSISV